MRSVQKKRRVRLRELTMSSALRRDVGWQGGGPSWRQLGDLWPRQAKPIADLYNH
jgi:hypothetical protein